MASIIERGPFQYQVLVRRRGYPIQTKTFETKRDAKARANVIEAEMVRGVFTDRREAEQTTLGDALERDRREVTSGLTSCADWDASGSDAAPSPFNDHHCEINPANGLPVVDGCGSVDVSGNPYGTDWSHDDSWVDSSAGWDDSFSTSSSSWDGGIGTAWDD